MGLSQKFGADCEVPARLVAYALPGALLLAGAARLGHLPRWLRLLLQALGVALVALYSALEIRRFWQGDDLSRPGVMQGELYSYTLALMLTGLAGFGFSRRRKAA